MLLNRAGEFLAVPLLILIATAAYGTPTASVHNSDVSVHASYSSEYTNVPSDPTLETNQIREAYNSHLANIADELLKPPTNFTNSAALLPAQVNSLPPVPGALFMVLVGFVCVSLVKDRKLWIAALAGLLWAGQAGFAALPQLASNLASKKQIEQQEFSSVTYAHELESSARSRCDIEGTQYIGLLRYLEGIPVTQMSFLRKQESRILSLLQSLRARRSNLKNQRNTQYDIRNTNKVPHFAIAISRTYLISAFICLSFEVRQFIYFSPAFIFENLARGPPNFT